MQTTEKYNALTPKHKEQIEKLIRKMRGKSWIADIAIYDSEIKNYEFRIEVSKYNTVKGWATIGFVRYDAKRDEYLLTYKPKLSQGEKSSAGRSGAYY